MNKKTAGILSMQRVINYGSFLQAYALKRLLEKNGADEVYFIDIERGRALPCPAMYGKRHRLHRIAGIARLAFTFKLFVKIRDKRYYNRLKRKFTEEYFGMLGLDKKGPAHYDLVVIGSDEVFNCQPRFDYEFTTQLFGEHLDARKIVSYAGSFGHTTLETLDTYQLKDEIKRALANLSEISVRDNNSFEIIRTLTGRIPVLNLDPVLIYDFSNEIRTEAVRHNDYIVLYAYHERIRDEKEIRYIRDFAKRHRKKLLSVFCRYDWCDEALVPDTPFDVLAYFKKADYIITDTFHGTIFSIITRSRFCTLVRDTNAQKLTSLLQMLHLPERIADSPLKINGILETGIDYAKTAETITTERIRTESYLRNALE